MRDCTRTSGSASNWVTARVDASATIHADEASHWDRLHAKFLTKRINPEWAHSDEGACTNQAELYFSRLSRAEVGQHHHIARAYLEAYSREIAWREDHRRASIGEQYLMIASAALARPVSRQWEAIGDAQNLTKPLGADHATQPCHQPRSSKRCDKHQYYILPQKFLPQQFP